MNSKQLKIYFLLLCIFKEKIVSDSNTKEPSRRDFIYVATAAAGAVTGAAAIWPLIDQMNPSADVQAL